ncbi:MAG: hypothetical protein AAB069_06305 [Planctomycetota bacterium]
MKRELNALREDAILCVHITNLPGFSLVSFHSLYIPYICLCVMRRQASGGGSASLISDGFHTVVSYKGKDW